MKGPSSIQGNLFEQEVHEITAAERAANEAAFQKIMAERQAAYDAEIKRKKDHESEPIKDPESTFRYELEIIEYDEAGNTIPTPEMMDWLRRQAEREALFRNPPEPPQQLQLELRQTYEPVHEEGSRAHD